MKHNNQLDTRCFTGLRFVFKFSSSTIRAEISCGTHTKNNWIRSFNGKLVPSVRLIILECSATWACAL